MKETQRLSLITSLEQALSEYDDWGQFVRHQYEREEEQEERANQEVDVHACTMRILCEMAMVSLVYLLNIGFEDIH